MFRRKNSRNGSDQSETKHKKISAKLIRRQVQRRVNTKQQRIGNINIENTFLNYFFAINIVIFIKKHKKRYESIIMHIKARS